jgi:hypothetical protein
MNKKTTTTALTDNKVFMFGKTEVVTAKFARKLERRLNEALARLAGTAGSQPNNPPEGK